MNAITVIRVPRRSGHLSVTCRGKLVDHWDTVLPILTFAWRFAAARGTDRGSCEMRIKDDTYWHGAAVADRVCKVWAGDLFDEPHLFLSHYRDIPTMEFKDWREMLLGVCVHELSHTFSPQHHGAKGEVFACAEEMKAIERWRNAS